MRRVRKTRRAELDLLHIWLHVACENIDAAERLFERLERCCGLFAEHPRLGRARSEIALEARSIVEGQYLILYRIVGRNVEIVRVIHGARDLTRLFRGTRSGLRARSKRRRTH